MNETVENALVGAMLGLACGDALGAPAEFLSRDDLQTRYGHLNEMVGNHLWAPGEWTDDTAMALCVAEGILENPDDPVPSVGKRFLAWKDSGPKDVGATISDALKRFRGTWSEAARNTHAALTGKAAGNGSLMRTLPVALAYTDTNAMLRQSARISAMTHWDPQAEVGCALYCLWIRTLLGGEDPLPAWYTALAQVKDAVLSYRALGQSPGPAPLPGAFWVRLENIEFLPEYALQPTGYAGYVVECLEAAVWWVIHSDSLEATLIGCVNLAGEADTIAAIAGGAAGAHWGVSTIPARWLDKLHDRERIEATAALWSICVCSILKRMQSRNSFMQRDGQEGFVGNELLIVFVIACFLCFLFLMAIGGPLPLVREGSPQYWHRGGRVYGFVSDCDNRRNSPGGVKDIKNQKRLPEQRQWVKKVGA